MAACEHCSSHRITYITSASLPRSFNILNVDREDLRRLRLTSWSESVDRSVGHLDERGEDSRKEKRAPLAICEVGHTVHVQRVSG